MDEVTLPIGTLGANSATLVSGTQFLYSFTSFTPASSGTCLVTLNAFITASAANAFSGSPVVRVASQTGGVDSVDPAFAPRFPPIAEPGHVSMSRTYAFSVVGGQSYKFGAQFSGTGGDWTGETAFVLPSYICV
jgi:hypothetical protein